MNNSKLQDLEAEKGLLGYLIKKPSAFGIVKGIIDAQIFIDQAHRNIYCAMLDWNADNGDWDEIGLGNILKKKETLEKSGGYTYLADLAEKAPYECNPAYYAKIIREHYLARKTLDDLDEMRKRILKGNDGIGEIVGEAVKNFQGVQAKLSSAKNKVVSVAEIVPEIFREAEQTAKTGKSPALSTGIDSLDDIFAGGLFRGKTNIVGGSPGSGKTALVANICNSAAEGIRILLVSLEHTSRSFVRDRLFPINTGVSSTRIRTPNNLTMDEWDKLGIGVDRLSGYHDFRICDQASMSISDIEMLVASEAKADGGGIDLFILDHVQRIRLPDGKGRRWEKFTEVSIRLCALIKELGLYSIIICPINRESAKQNRRPQMSDLKECSQFESDADSIGFLYRPDRDSPETTFIMDKHRNGPTGDVHLYFNKRFTRFEEGTNAYSI